MSDAIHLQGIGRFAAKPAADLKPGDRVVWNYGSCSDVVTVKAKGKSIYVTMRTDDGKVWPERRFLASRLIACTGLGGKVKQL
jgi:hypothetical protein